MGDDISWIELRLADQGNGRTLFQLNHIAHVDDERWSQFGPGAAGLGWTRHPRLTYSPDCHCACLRSAYGG